MKILLINLPQSNTTPPFYLPSGLAYIAAILESENYIVKILDIFAEELTFKDVINYLENMPYFNVIGISGYITQSNYVINLTFEIKEFFPIQLL